MKLKKIETIFKKFTTVEELTVTHNDDTHEIIRERVNKPDAVCAVVRKKGDRFLFVKQYRPGSNSDLLELVAGKIDDGENALAAICREIEEELGYEVDKVEKLVPNFYVSPGYSTEQISIFSVVVSNKISKGGGIDDEEIEIVEEQSSYVRDLLESNEFVDGKTIIGLTAYFNKLKNDK